MTLTHSSTDSQTLACSHRWTSEYEHNHDLTVISEGRSYQPFKDGRLGMIDARDIGEAAAKVLPEGATRAGCTT